MTGVGSKDGNLLSQFRFERILSENSLAKSVAVFGKLPSDTGDNSTVVLVEKTPFTEETVKNFLTGNTTFTHNSQHDNIGQYTSDAGIKLTVIHPATEKHVKEYTHQDTVMVQETATAYATKIKPYAEVEARNLQWMDDILAGRTATDKVIYNDKDPETGFVLLVDERWTEEKMEDLLILAIVRKNGILCLREVNGSHLALLENVYEHGKKAISDRYNIPLNQIRAYFHHHPSFYRLHIHFTMASYHPQRSLGRTHLMEDVIENIRHVDSDYYAKRTITLEVKENSPILALLNK